MLSCWTSLVLNVPNPAWRLVQALATVTSPKGVITIDGFSSHIAPISEEDVEVLKSIELDEVGLKREFRISGWVRSMKGQTLVKEHIFGATCTICGIQTGHTDAGAKTVLPSTAMARLDFRLVPDLTSSLVVGLLREHLDDLHRISQILIERETIDKDQFVRLLSGESDEDVFPADDVEARPIPEPEPSRRPQVKPRPFPLPGSAMQPPEPEGAN